MHIRYIIIVILHIYLRKKNIKIINYNNKSKLMKHLIETTDLSSLGFAEYDRLILNSAKNEIVYRGGVKYEVIPDEYIYNEADNKYYQKIVGYGKPIKINSTVDLNSQWVSDTEDSNYKYFKSNSNVGVNNSYSQCKVTWSNLTSITFKYMSSSEIVYDYLCIGKLDGEKFTARPSDGGSNVYLSTKDKESGTYYEFTIECDEGEHHIWFCYRKDSSGNEGEDRGFIGVPKSVVSVLDIKQGSELPMEYKYGGVSAEGGKTYDINYNSVTLPNGTDIVPSYEDYTKTEKAINTEYVDLGLKSGTLWAKCNIGATSETDYGVYFQWGETSGISGSLLGKYSDENYTWASYTHCNGTANTLTKYNTSTSYGENPDKITTLELVDDAATQIMGGNWRMPTPTEYQTLYNETLWVWCPGGNVGIKKTDESGNESIEYIAYPTGFFVFKTESDKDKKQRGTFTKDKNNNLTGYTATSGTVYYPGAHEVTEGDVTSIADGDIHIFFPVSGYVYGTGVNDGDSRGYYWSSSLSPYNSSYGFHLHFNSGLIRPQNDDKRCYGFCVRSVLENLS